MKRTHPLGAAFSGSIRDAGLKGFAGSSARSAHPGGGATASPAAIWVEEVEFGKHSADDPEVAALTIYSSKPIFFATGRLIYAEYRWSRAPPFVCPSSLPNAIAEGRQ
jgi:hypothetical protein